ncbi:hypothetical protein APHAL10511_000838 [Amanita phalloides]|nr:hypothetical protein APHAL10511_000838 [Amanita phalloides]
MLSKSTLPIFITVAFALSTLAHSHPQRQDGPITIPDFHNNSIDDNGTVIINDLAWSLVDAGTLQRRTNGPAAIVPLSKKGDVYTGPITVGTLFPVGTPQNPYNTPQRIDVMFDTGIRTSWLASIWADLPSPHTYNRRRSSTSMTSRKDFSNVRGVTGTWFWDVFNVGGIVTKKVQFGNAVSRGAYGSNLKVEGVIGVAASISPEPAEESFFYSVQQQHHNVRSFGFYFGEEKAEFQLGVTVERNAHTHQYPMITVKQAGGVAGLDDANMFVDNKLLPKKSRGKTETVFSSGWQWTSGPPDEVDELYTKLGGKKWKYGYIIPCDNKHVVSFSWGKSDEKWEISAKNLIFPDNQPKPNMCRGTIRANSHIRGHLWILGLNFMSGKHIIYDFASKEISIADAK